MRRAWATLPTILWLSLLASACALFRPQLERPHIDLVGIEIRETGLLRQRYLLTLNVQNPNDLAIPVRGLSYTLQVAGSDFATGVSPKAFTLPAYGETEVQLELTTSLLSLLGNLQELLTLEREALDYRLDGKLEVDLPFVDTIPFRNSGELRLSQRARRTGGS